MAKEITRGAEGTVYIEQAPQTEHPLYAEVDLNILPDIIVESISLNKNTLKAGETLTVNWSCSNIGDCDAVTDWNDAVYISKDNKLDDSDSRLKGYISGNILKKGESYSRQLTVDISRGLSGDYYIIIKTNDLGQINENSIANNTKNSPIFTVSDIEPPTVQITSGPADGVLINSDSVSYSWTGSDNSTEPLTYAVSISTDSPLLGGDQGVGSFTDLRTDDFTLSEGDGTYYLTLFAKDAAGNISTPATNQFTLDTASPTVTGISLNETQNQPFSTFQLTFSEPVSSLNANNITITDPDQNIIKGDNNTDFVCCEKISDTIWQITLSDNISNEGAYTVTVSGITDIAGNQLTSEYSKTVTLSLPDLTLENITYPASVFSGEQFEIKWTDKNIGTGAAGPYKTKLYLSQDNILDSNDTLLKELSSEGFLNSNSSILNSTSLSAPQVVAGTTTSLLKQILPMNSMKQTK